MAMILIGLGFTQRRLYLASDFLENKPFDLLIKEGLTAAVFNDDVLGKALDSLYAANVTDVFSDLSEKACSKLGIETNFAHLDSTSFHVACEADSVKEQQRFNKSLKFSCIYDINYSESHKFMEKGRPKKDEEPCNTVWKISNCIATSLEARNKQVKGKGMFILATNELDEKKLTDIEIFLTYKGQAQVESGFRFLKNPQFMASTIFLKNPQKDKGTHDGNDIMPYGVFNS